MEKLEIHPTNQQYFHQLLSFGDEVNKLCLVNNIRPIVYGSLAYIFYTHDETIAINDIDFLVDENTFEKLTELLSTISGTSCETTDYHSIKFFKNGCKIAFDSIEHYLNDTNFQSVNVIINEKDFELLDRETLKIVYQRGVNNIPAKRDAYDYKLKKLIK